MNTLVVGDLHGKLELAQAALATEHNVIFIGDYLDSFDRSVEDQVETLKLVLDAAEQEERVTALMGNHELSYLMWRMQCSGYNGATAAHVIHLANRMWKTLKPYHWLREDILVSHAGVSQELLEDEEITLKEYLDSEEFYSIGQARGGPSETIGGLYWNDFNFEMTPVPGLVQIVGHTAGDGIRKKENGGTVYCIDTLDRYPKALLVPELGDPYEVEL